MVFSTAPQHPSTYQLWKRFAMPVEGGIRDAISVPNLVANQLTSAYTILVTAMIVNLWCIIFALVFFLLLPRLDGSNLHYLSTALWNKRSSMADSFLDLLQSHRGRWRADWWIYGVLVAVAACWVCQTALSIVVPPYIFLGSAAPVNPSAIFVPPNLDRSLDTESFALDVPAALRATGSAQVASEDLVSRVKLTTTRLGTRPGGDAILRVDYSYSLSGTDFGLQHFPTLQLQVSGACTTEYGWHLNNNATQGEFKVDQYALFGNTSNVRSVSIYDGAAPVASFYNGLPGTGPEGNMTFAVLVSSIDRISYTPGTDPLYATTLSNDTGVPEAPYVVKPERPVLSCWEADTWSFGGRSASVLGLNDTALPGLTFPPVLQRLFTRYLGQPRIVNVGSQLGLANLLSSTTALGSIFNAGGSSMEADLSRLLLAAYIATANTLIDTTLYPPTGGANRQTNTGNWALDDTGRPAQGVGDFVVFSSDVSTLSVKAIILIPVVSALLWLTEFIVLRFTPLRSVNSLDAIELHKSLNEVATLEKSGWVHRQTTDNLASPNVERGEDPMTTSNWDGDKQRKGVRASITETSEE